MAWVAAGLLGLACGAERAEEPSGDASGRGAQRPAEIDPEPPAQDPG